MADEMKTRSVRATEDTFEKLKEIVEQSEFNNQGEALTALISLWENEQAKNMLPDRKTEIENFQALTQRINDSYINSLQLNIEAEDRIRMEFAGTLKSNETTINLLQEQKADSIEKVKRLEAEMDLLQKTNNELRISLDAAKATLDSTKVEYDKSLDDKDSLNRVLTTNAAKDQDKIKELSEKLAAGKDYEKLLQEANDKLKQQLNRSTELQAAIDEATRVHEASMERMKNQLAENDRTHAHELQMKDLESKNQLLEAERAAQAKIDEQQTKFLERFDALEKKHTAEIERLEKRYAANQPKK